MHSDKKLPLTRYWQYVGGSAVNNHLFFNLTLMLYCAFVQEIPHIANTRPLAAISLDNFKYLKHFDMTGRIFWNINWSVCYMHIQWININIMLLRHFLKETAYNRQFCVMLAGRCVLNFCTHFTFRLNVKHSFFKCQHERKAGRTLCAIKTHHS